MSVRVLSWVLDNSEAPGNDRLVLIAIADEADDDGTNAYPSIDRISRRARVNKRTTMRSLERLEGMGELVVVRPDHHGRGHFNRYAVVMDREPGDVRDLILGTVNDDNVSPLRKGAKRRAKARPGVHQTHRPTDPSVLPLEETETDARDTVSANADASRLCELLADLVADDGTKRPRVTKRWLDACDKLIRLDGHEPEQIERAIRWCQNDSFWSTVVLSMPKLREKYDQLRKAAMRESSGSARPSSGPRAAIEEMWDRDAPTRVVKQ